MTFTIQEMAAAYVHRMAVAGSKVDPQSAEEAIRAVSSYARGLILGNLFRCEADLEYCLEKYMAEMLGLKFQDFYLGLAGIAADNELARYCIEFARDEIEETGTAKLVRVPDIDKEINGLYENGIDPGITTEWAGLGKIYRVAKRQLCVVTGMGGIGKSTWLENFLVRLALATNWKFCFYSPENYPIEFHFERLASIYSSMPFFQGPHERLSRSELDDVKKWIGDHFLFISSDDNATLGTCMNVFRQAIEKDKVDGIIIDPWNTLEHKRPENQNETDYVCECLTKCISFTRHRNVAMWIVAHPAKMRPDKEGKYPAPTPYDIAGSAHWANRPDVNLTVYKREDGNTELIVNKMRYRMYGRTGTVLFSFDIPTNRFTEIADGSAANTLLKDF